MVRWGFRKITVIATCRMDRKETSWEVTAVAHEMRHISKVRWVGVWRGGMRDTGKETVQGPWCLGMGRGGIPERFPISGLNCSGGCHQQRWGMEMEGQDPCRDTENTRQKKRTR